MFIKKRVNVGQIKVRTIENKLTNPQPDKSL